MDPVDSPPVVADEDEVLPVFDDDDFFPSDQPDAEVIDLTAESGSEIGAAGAAGAGMAGAGMTSVDEPTQAFSIDDSQPLVETVETVETVDSAEAADEPTGDAFLEELRRAVSEDSGETDDDPALVAFFDDDSDGPTRRFGRQR